MSLNKDHNNKGVFKRRRWLKLSAALAAAVSITGVSAYAAWDGYLEEKTAETASLSLLNFNNVGAILETGGMASQMNARDGNIYSVLWNNHTANQNIYFRDIPKDWSGYDKLELWIYSEKATGGEFMVIPECEYGVDGSYNYFSAKYRFDWEGWKQFSIGLAGMSANRSPDWEKMISLRLTVQGWNMIPTDAAVYIGSAALKEGSGTSLDSLYSDDTINAAKAAMEGGAAIYGGSPNVVVTDGQVKTLDSDNTNICAYKVGSAVMVPLCFFRDYFGAAAEESTEAYSLSLGDKRVAGKANEAAYENTGKQNSFTVPAQMIDGRMYVPAAETAEALGLTAVCDRAMVAVSTNEAVKVLERPAGVNELAEVIAYLAAHITVNATSLTAEDCRIVKDKWRYELVGSETDNDMNNPYIANKIKGINDSGQNAWNNMIKKAGQTELFGNMTTTTSNHMTQTYSKLKDMALAYGTCGTALYHNETLKQDILYGLEWLYNNRYGQAEMNGTGWRSTSAFNWWDWQIGVPQNLIPIMLIVEDSLTMEQKSNYLALFDKLVPSARDVGSNALNTAKYACGSALLQNDTKKVLRVQAAIESVYLYVDNDRNKASQLYGNRAEDKGQGFYTDGSYIFHTLHPMNATYGLEQFQLIGPFVSMFADTPFAITNPQVDNVAEWIYNAFDPLVYQGATFRMVRGRHPTGAHSLGNGVLKAMLDALESLTAEDQAKVKSIIKAQVRDDTTVDFYSTASLPQLIRLIKVMEDHSVQPRESLITNHVYHNEDKIVHQRGYYALGISMSSSRIFNYECINNENMTGWYVGDGMTEYFVKGQFQQSKDVYWNNVNPYRLPGTTVDTQQRKEATIAQGNEYLSSKDFVGGVSLDDTYGTAAMWLESYHNDTDFGKDAGEYGGPAPAHDCDLQAKKAWFMFDDEVVCLGSDVNASNGFEVLTVVDNKLAVKTKNMTENAANTPYDIQEAEASETPEPENVAENTLDGNFTTKWASETGATIIWDLGEEKQLGFIILSFQNGSKRTQKFVLETSNDKRNWKQTFAGSSNGTTETGEAFTLDNSSARYVRFTNQGNSAGTTWVSLTTATIYPPNPDGSLGVPEVKVVGADTFTVDGAEKILSGEGIKLTGAKWAHMENVGGYYFPAGGELFARYTESATSFMELWFSHGVSPTGGSYAYTLLPGKTAEETGAYAQNPDVEVLANTPELQAVRDNKLNATGMVFWQAGSFEGITVSQPMIVMMQDQDGETRISACDPTQKLTEATITVNRALMPMEKDSMMTIQPGTPTKIIMNLAGSDGRTMEAVFANSGAL